MNTLNVPQISPIDRTLLKTLTATFMVLITGIACAFMWAYVSIGFVMNAIPDNQMKVLVWSGVGIMCWVMTFAGTTIVLRLGGKSAGKGSVKKIFILTSYMAAGVALCMLAGYAATVLFTGSTMYAIVIVAIELAAALMWAGFHQCHKCWLGAKLA